jgi:hypothetical protein
LAPRSHSSRPNSSGPNWTPQLTLDYEHLFGGADAKHSQVNTGVNVSAGKTGVRSDQRAFHQHRADDKPECRPGIRVREVADFMTLPGPCHGADEKRIDDRAWLVEQRYRAALKLLDGSPVSEVAVRYGVSRQSVYSWEAKHAAAGINGSREVSRL